ncbi:MarR family winged helix-turn-helix transcriptional regulator [Guptibacillus hwajinpoensis]|uniref:MarR family winged helix-turn-helix transcriptional regulator n=1 Tax=Guptibacillus hwajinpoensis TaxID=208199 RepID=UPI00210744EC|nr:MarR family transcriptional regulator [Pseudalkalibacillus hwajinpoensis]WLR57873.1 MarR family transcriptional regulator [Pseudalkalibacillus hwajinpoensis]
MNHNEQLKLENQLCFSVYACSREITKMYRPYLNQLDITYPQYLVLLVLWEKHETTVKALGSELYLDSGTLTPLLKRMEEAGLVMRERSKEDERRVMVRLTPKGEGLREEASIIPDAMAANSGLSKEEFTKALSGFQQLLDHIHSVNEK